MNQPPVPPPPKRKTQLQGPRPPDLKVSKDSHQIRKPFPHPQQIHHHYHQQQLQTHQPLIIYSVSPKVIHTTVGDFSSLVQRLTGPSMTSSGDLSPAARFASIEKASTSERDRSGIITATTTTSSSSIDDFMAGFNFDGIDMGQFAGILSPSPANLPPIPSGYFSPISDMQTHSFLHELSPFWPGNNCSMASPSALFSTPLVSPSPSSFDIFRNLFDF